ncbi:MAG TPA: poly-gamma-glutamate hydrolase family protein, partial [Acidimicrobiales bacterium]
MLAELLGHPGVEERCELRSRFGLFAFHGGNLERGTDAIATAAADEAGASLYVVRQPPDLRWHVPSTAFDPAASPRLAAFVEHVDVAVAVHGYGREGMWTTLLLGGRNRPLAADLAVALRARLGDGFDVVDDLAAIPERLRGQHPR